MAEFAAGRLNVLVATTVIEVGVDVPQCRLMVIEHAERVGLAQLHQLRGRVGVARQKRVLLFAEPLSELPKRGWSHLRSPMASNRRQVNIRGPGEFLGARQAAFPCCALPTLKKNTSFRTRREIALC